MMGHYLSEMCDDDLDFRAMQSLAAASVWMTPMQVAELRAMHVERVAKERERLRQICERARGQMYGPEPK